MLFLAELSLSDLTIIGALGAGLLTLIKIGDRLWFKAKSDDSPEYKQMYEKVEKLYEQHNHFDQDGVPMWYVPRSWANTQKEIVTTQNTIAFTLQTISNTLSQLEKVLERTLTDKK